MKSKHQAFGDIYLEDLFVLEEHRGKSYGKKLLVRLAVLDWTSHPSSFINHWEPE